MGTFIYSYHFFIISLLGKLVSIASKITSDLFFIIKFLYFYLFLATPHGMWDLFPDQGLNPCPLYWKGRVLTAGQPGKSLLLFSHHVMSYSLRPHGL